MNTKQVFMIIHVGSMNRVKIDAVAEVIRLYDFLCRAEVRGVNVSSGVADQPKTLDETIQGAKNRAQSAFAGSDYSVGLESGLIELCFEGATHSMDHTVCAIYNGEQYSLGFSPAFEVPSTIVKIMKEEGLNLEQACYKTGLTGNPSLGRAQGLVGILTQGIMDRKAYTKPAIIMALVGFQNRSLY